MQSPEWMVELAQKSAGLEDPRQALVGWARGLVQKTAVTRASLWAVDGSGKMMRQAAVWPAGQQGKTPAGDLLVQILAGRFACMDAVGGWTSLEADQPPVVDVPYASLFFPLTARQRVIGCLVVEAPARVWQVEFPWLVLAAAFIAREMDGFQLVHVLRTRGTQPVSRQPEKVELTLNPSDDERIKSEFIALVSHELRTPLNAMLGMSEMLLSTPLTDRQKEYAGVVHDSAQLLEKMVAELVDYAEIQAGRITLNELPYDPRAVVRTVMDELGDSAGKKGIKINSQVEPGTPRSIEGDPYRMRQMVHHLVENAIKYTEKGSIDLRVRPEVEDSGTPLLVVEVVDTGIGLSEEEQKRLFQPFGQADTSKTRKYGGTGLGLAMVKALMELHQGRVELHSQKGVGSSFFLYVPVRVLEAGDQQAEPQAANKASAADMTASDPLECQRWEDESILDSVVIQDLRQMETGGQSGFLKELTDMFFEEGVLQLNEFRRKTSEDSLNAREPLRQVRDMAGNLGARRLKLLCDVLLQQPEVSTEDWPVRVNAVEQEFKSACDMLRIERER